MILVAAAAGLGCKAKVPTITEPFVDDFERAEVGPVWLNTGADYRIAGGKLNVAGAYNHPLWLRRKLPRDVVIDVDVMSKSEVGDIKVELCGDGESFDPDRNRYDPTGYMFVFGGWGNALSIISKLGEHDDAVKVERDSPPGVGATPGKAMEIGRTYHWTITKKGNTLDWRVDGQPFLSWTDPQPLGGAGHEYFGINNWESDVYFDNLRIRPAP